MPADDPLVRAGAAERGRGGGARVGRALGAGRAAARAARGAARALPHPRRPETETARSTVVPARAYR